MTQALSRLKGLLLSVAILALGGKLSATWSIILVDTRTGEVAIGSATCLTGWDLRTLTPVLVVGRGGACAQSYVDFSGRTRQAIWNGFRNGTSPRDILATLARIDPQHQTRQYGIVDAAGLASTFSGTSASNWKGGVTGKFGTIAYAIQGNILTGAPVVNAAETAVRTTPGDLATKLMAGMEAARKMGGDGRCSCPQGPTACGAPPANFTKTAHIGFVMVGRAGDQDGTCTPNGCANGNYFLNLNVIGTSNAPDPVFTLKRDYDAWRRNRAGRPDHHLSTFRTPNASLPADNKTRTTARLVLHDIEGQRITSGGAKITVSLLSGSAVQIGTVQDHGDGSYSIPLQAGAQAGTAKLRVLVDDGQRTVQIAPAPTIEMTSNALWVSNPELQAARGGTLEFVIHEGPSKAGQPYILLASHSGTQPGTLLGPGLTLPLNIDALFWTVFFASGTSFPGFIGTLDSTGRQTVQLPMPPGLYALAVPSSLHFASLLHTPLGTASNPVEVRLVR